MLNSFELVKSLEKRKIWQEYMTQNECKILKDALRSSDSFNEFMNQKEIALTSKYLAMVHTQQMLSEQLLSNLYKDIPKCPIDKEPNPTLQMMKSIFKPPILDDDDDNYDFDEEEDEETKVNVKVEEKSESKDNKKEEEESENERDIILDDMYYTLEYDEDAEEEFNNKKLDDEKEKEKPKVQLPVRNYLDLPNAKFLSAYIDKHMSSKESFALKTLISDLKPISKSKWYNEDRVGQDVLYDHCERILNELKNYVEHSGPFLNKVNKRDAPNYYEIIKKPMDLSLMTRKMKGLQYNSKEEFANDLELIWSNCLAYNTDPKSPFRTHAIKMRAKANILIKSVPDITIKVKGDSDSEDDASHLIKEEIQANTMDDNKVNAQQDEINDGKEERELFEKGEDIKTEKWKEESLEVRAKNFIEMENEFKKPFNERKFIKRDPFEMQKYYDSEKEAVQKLKKYFKNNKENSSLNNIEDPQLKNSDDTNNNNNNIPSTSKINTSKSFFPEYMYFSSSIPEIPQIPYDIGTKIIPSNEFNRNEMKEIPLLHEYDDIRQEKEGDSLTSIMCRNIIELRTIQTLFYKIQAKQIGNEIPPSENVPTLFEDVERKFIPESLPPLIMDERTGRILLKKYIAQIFAHTGFDNTQKEALEITIDVVIRYIHNIGHSLKMYIDQFSKDTDFLTILEKVLSINQCNPKSLYYYMKNSIQKFGLKLVDLRKKLDYTYNDLCSPQKNSSMYDDDGFMDDDDAFISGNFGEDLGIDFFGFKQMGIDVSNIPAEIWRRNADHPVRSKIRQARRQAYFMQQSQPTSKTYQQAPKFKPITDLNSQVIGLLKPYYQKKMIENDMVEDENKSSRVRSKIMRNKMALKKKRDEEDNRRHKEKEQIKKELKLKEKKEEKEKSLKKNIKADKDGKITDIKKEIETENSQIIMASGTTTANSTPKSTPVSTPSASTIDRKSIKIESETPSSIIQNQTPSDIVDIVDRIDKNEKSDNNDNEKKRKRDDKTDSNSVTSEIKKIKSEAI